MSLLCEKVSIVIFQIRFEAHPAPSDDQVTWHLGDETIHAGEVCMAFLSKQAMFANLIGYVVNGVKNVNLNREFEDKS